jgi:hypothetical protein
VRRGNLVEPGRNDCERLIITTSGGKLPREESLRKCAPAVHDFAARHLRRGFGAK